MKRFKPEISSGSMADIAFLLLIFFLVTTTIDIDKGILVRLPPIQDQPIPPVQKRNIFNVKVNYNDELMVRGEIIQVVQLKDKAKEFIMNPEGKSDLAIAPNQAVISLQNDRSTSYNIYITVYNELKAAYNELWDELCQKKTRSALTDPGFYLLSSTYLRSQMIQI